jgi:hypothetical protein
MQLKRENHLFYESRRLNIQRGIRPFNRLKGHDPTDGVSTPLIVITVRRDWLRKCSEVDYQEKWKPPEAITAV